MQLALNVCFEQQLGLGAAEEEDEAVQFWDAPLSFLLQTLTELCSELGRGTSTYVGTVFFEKHDR